jgi:hypothetical protein
MLRLLLPLKHPLPLPSPKHNFYFARYFLKEPLPNEGVLNFMYE